MVYLPERSKYLPSPIPFPVSGIHGHDGRVDMVRGRRGREGGKRKMGYNSGGSKNDKPVEKV